MARTRRRRTYVAGLAAAVVVLVGGMPGAGASVRAQIISERSVPRELGPSGGLLSSRPTCATYLNAGTSCYRVKVSQWFTRMRRVTAANLDTSPLTSKSALTLLLRAGLSVSR